MSFIQTLIDKFNARHSHETPIRIASKTILVVGLVYVLLKLYLRIRQKGFKGAFLGFALAAVKFVPGASQYTDKVKHKLRDQLVPDFIKELPINYSLPKNGLKKEELLGQLQKYSKHEVSIWGEGKASGAIYHGDLERLKTATEAYSYFALSNPLHPELFPYTRQLEAEVIRMTIDLFQGTMEQCGVMTSGGTESILMAIKAYRDQARTERGVIHPELVVPSTAHAAFDKACGYFGIKQIIIPVDIFTQRVDPKLVEKHITANTIAIVGSAPTYPHGCVDPIPQLAALGRKHNIGLHVDCCLGSYLIPFARILGVEIPQFDFSVDGVTSISIDTHKYGYSPKGSSVLLFKNEKLRQYMYYVSTAWVGGVYASPTIAGSRPGAIVASTWATIMSFGYDGYRSHAVGILETANQIRDQILNNKALRRDGKGNVIPHPNDIILVGDAKLSVVAFGLRHQIDATIVKRGGVVKQPAVQTDEPLLDIFAINTALVKSSHWHLNKLQNPPCVHLCVTHANREQAMKSFLDDLNAAVETVKKDPAEYSSNSTTQLYGVADAINIDEETNNAQDLSEQDQTARKNNIVGEMAMAYIDTLTYLPTPEEDKAIKAALRKKK